MLKTVENLFAARFPRNEVSKWVKSVEHRFLQAMCCGRMSFANCGQSMTRAQLAGKVLADSGVHKQKCLHQDTSYFTHPMLRCRTVKFRHCGICRNTSTSCGANCDGIGRGQNTKRVVVVGDRREWSDADGAASLSGAAGHPSLCRALGPCQWCLPWDFPMAV